MTQDKNSEIKFWDTIAKTKTLIKYSAFDVEELNMIFDRFIGEQPYVGMRILDVGCGTGVSSMLLASRGADVMGIDISEEFIKIAKEFESYEHWGTLEFKVMDVENIDKICKAFDFVFFGGVLHHFPEYDDRSNIIEKVYKILKPNGKIILVEPNSDDKFQLKNWKLAKKKGLLTENEWCLDPIDTLVMLWGNGYHVEAGNKPNWYFFRRHLSYLGLKYPRSRKLFPEHGETTIIERILRFPFDYRKTITEKGNFFVVCGVKKELK